MVQTQFGSPPQKDQSIFEYSPFPELPVVCPQIQDTALQPQQIDDPPQILPDPDPNLQPNQTLDSARPLQVYSRRKVPPPTSDPVQSSSSELKDVEGMIFTEDPPSTIARHTLSPATSASTYKVGCSSIAATVIRGAASSRARFCAFFMDAMVPVSLYKGYSIFPIVLLNASQAFPVRDFEISLKRSSLSWPWIPRSSMNHMTCSLACPICPSNLRNSTGLYPLGYGFMDIHSGYGGRKSMSITTCLFMSMNFIRSSLVTYSFSLNAPEVIFGTFPLDEPSPPTLLIHPSRKCVPTDIPSESFFWSLRSTKGSQLVSYLKRSSFTCSYASSRHPRSGVVSERVLVAIAFASAATACSTVCLTMFSKSVEEMTIWSVVASSFTLTRPLSDEGWSGLPLGST
ncbi:uncharacterized protein G2W53_009576 [Senna tora]|uniref:Uncharacterized protein n=1 Tax=Senna tora TaxID=362788 RepID=A0A834WYZ0_9FABA|nr:uncharacterized protein G2W53_009576 [Senna tora]